MKGLSIKIIHHDKPVVSSLTAPEQDMFLDVTLERMRELMEEEKTKEEKEKIPFDGSL